MARSDDGPKKSTKGRHREPLYCHHAIKSGGKSDKLLAILLGDSFVLTDKHPYSRLSRVLSLFLLIVIVIIIYLLLLADTRLKGLGEVDPKSRENKMK